ncbi:hypothetical protein [Hymenobacter cellulosivorans]|uniref:Uncharacterized protein n=1 Tax=Hymenobacter cellulosivorans TaxID=2932249 RepID=A0ABY4F983_9BACT|nr:hypothetical protein [Hymenobacter cellulosivorans]UOQ51026.1 hypothetical protein MUN80_14795 [Hymenobacter cellulosivorans]
MKSKHLSARPTSAPESKNKERVRHNNFSVELDPLPWERDQEYLALRARGPEPLRPMDFDRPGW